MWTRTMLDELAPAWRKSLPDGLHDPAALTGTDPYIAHEDMIALWSRYTDEHADPLFGVHFAERHAEGAVGMYSHAAAHAPDFGAAARACIQLQRMIDTHGTMAMVSIDGGVSIRHVPPAGIDRWPAHLAESLAAGCVHLGRMFSGRRITPREACFQHAAFSGRDASAWFGCPVRYEQPWNALLFDEATFAIPFRHADATHFTAMIAAVSRILDEVAPNVSIVDDARAVLRARQGQKTSLATLARQLKVSERSLQRRLAEAGVTFRQLADEVRLSTLAEQASKPQKGRVTAEALGYSDPSSIRRLRKRARRPR
jgi:AraC-like DNA-binding protein